MEENITEALEETELVDVSVEQKEMSLVPSNEIEHITCDEVKQEEVEEVFSLVQEMIKFCHEKGGVGLAAPQIGINKKFFVWVDGDKWQVAINPSYFPDGKTTMSLLERCLSYSGKYFRVKRYKRITAVFYNIDGKTGKLKKYSRKLSSERAWVFQHETDHLFGKTVNTEGEDMLELVEKEKTILNLNK